ncbi:MAG: prepilin-type N-terminal cleavage/methylation domain-containing protein [Patescibacteria group bacterium]|mgnify:CR=1 FL=1
MLRSVSTQHKKLSETQFLHEVEMARAEQILFHQKHCARGFTLVESMVSISILLIGVTSAMGLASTSIATASYTRNRLTASMLAQEAMEAVQSERDSNFLRLLHFDTSLRSGTWLTGTAPAPNLITDPPCTTPGQGSKQFIVTIPTGSKTTSTRLANTAAGDSNQIVYEQTLTGGKKIFIQASTPPGSSTQTIFRRYVTVTESAFCGGDDNSVQEIIVTATVFWEDRNGNDLQHVVSTRMFNWLPNSLQTP